MAPRIPVEDDEVESQIDNENVEDETDEGGEHGDVEDEDESQDVEEAEDDLAARAPRREAAQRETAVVRAQRLAREARAEADKNARELAELRAEVQRQRAPSETPEQEAARLSLMDPDQRSEYRFNKAMENQNRQMAAMHARLADQSDKSTFAAACVSDPLLKTVAANVAASFIRSKIILAGMPIAQCNRGSHDPSRPRSAGELSYRQARTFASARRNQETEAGWRTQHCPPARAAGRGPQ